MTKHAAKEPAARASRGPFLKRAAWAGVLIAALLGGLVWLERNPPTPAETPLVAPFSDTSPAAPDALPRGAPPMPSAAEVENMVAERTQAGDASTDAAPELTSAPVVVDAPARVDDAPPPADGAPRLVLEGEGEGDTSAETATAPAATATQASKADAPPPDAPAPATADREPSAGAPAPKANAPAKQAGTARPTVSDGYLVQLGVFASPKNALALREKVEALGIPTHIESRVVVGPFRDRAEAAKAREKLRTSGLGKGLVLPTR